MLNSQQNIMPYAYEMVNDLPGPSGINNSTIPSLAPNMLTPMNNVQSFMPTMTNMQATYKKGGSTKHRTHKSHYDRGLMQQVGEAIYQNLPGPGAIFRQGLKGAAALGGNQIAGRPGAFVARGIMSQMLHKAGYADGGTVPSQHMGQRMAGYARNVGNRLNNNNGISRDPEMYKYAPQVAGLMSGLALTPNIGPIGGVVGGGIGGAMFGAGDPWEDAKTGAEYGMYGTGLAAPFEMVHHFPHFAEGGHVGLEALLAQMSPEEIEELMEQYQAEQAGAGSTEDNLPNWGQDDEYMLPHYKKGGIFRKFEKKVIRPVAKTIKPIAKAALPVAGGIIGNLVGGPVGGAIGAAAGAKLAGGKHSTRNAVVAGLGGYALAGGFGELGGLGNVANKMTPSGLKGFFGGAGAKTAAGIGAAGAGAVNAAKAPEAAGLLGGNALSNLLLPVAIGGTLLGKREVPKEEKSLQEQINEMRPNWGPEHMGRPVKPMKRVQNILGPDEQGRYFDVVNPETEYYADGGHVPFHWSPEQMGRNIKPLNRRLIPNGPNAMGKYFDVVNPEIEYMAHGGYLHGDESGQADTIPAKLSDGEYVLSADVVSHLGDGNNAAGAKRLDAFMRKVRTHRLKSGGNLPPKALGIESYLNRRRA